ncbi:MAG: CCA tRNA nucleotidyltransferase [Dehalococcoidales bacterium]
MQPSASSLLTRVSQFLTEQGIKSYLIGGLVRDMLLGRDTADIDIAVAADALEVAPRVAKALGGKYVLLDEVNRIGRVVVSSQSTRWELDFSTIEGSLEQDLARRDFTIDAMAIELETAFQSPVLIDPFNGYDDLGQGIIRAVAEIAFPADPVRLLRAVRLAAELNFKIESQTKTLIRRYSHLVASVAGERVREELLRLLAMSRGGQLLTYLDELGLLTVMFPELVQTKGAEQPKEHFWDVFQHSIQTVAAADFLFRQGDWAYADAEVLSAVPWSAELKQHFDQEVSHGSTRKSLLKLAALLHDLAKPQTKTIEESGRMRFLGHAKEGATIATDILERLRFSSKEIKLVGVMIKYHLRPTQMSHDELPSRRAIYRYFRDAGEAGIDILFLSLADHLASRGQYLDRAQWQEHAQLVAYVLAQHFEEESLTVPPKLIDGHDLMDKFGLSPGAKIGEILEAVREAQAAGEVTTKEEALAYIEHLLISPSSKNK